MGHSVPAQDSDIVDALQQHPVEWDRPREQELGPREREAQERQSTQDFERNRLNQALEDPRVGRNGSAVRGYEMQHGQDNPGLEEPGVGWDGDDVRRYEMQRGQDDQALEEPKVGRDGDDVRRYVMQHGQDDQALEVPGIGWDGGRSKRPSWLFRKRYCRSLNESEEALRTSACWVLPAGTVSGASTSSA